MEYVKAIKDLLAGIADDDAALVQASAMALSQLVEEEPISRFEQAVAKKLAKTVMAAIEYAGNCAYDEPCLQCIHPSCPNYGGAK